MSFSDLNSIINSFDDNNFWEPLHNDEDALNEFDEHMKNIEESKTWPKNLNAKKGKVLEDLAVFLFKRFYDTKVTQNNRVGDNETDIEAALSDKIRPQFMNDYMGPKIICECKNKKSSSIDVGMVTKLAELVDKRQGKMGIFISILGVGGYGWRYGEGKRKKLMYKDRLAIISFKIEDLKRLREGSNFYTMIKEKVNALVDEVEDNSPDIPNQQHYEYSKRIFEVFSHLKECEIMSKEEMDYFQDKVINKYGPVNQ